MKSGRSGTRNRKAHRTSKGASSRRRKKNARPTPESKRSRVGEAAESFANVVIEKAIEHVIKAVLD